MYQNIFGNYLASGVSSISARCFHKINVCNHSDHLRSLSVCPTYTQTHTRTYAHTHIHVHHFYLLIHLFSYICFLYDALIAQTISTVCYNEQQVITLKGWKRKWL